MIDSRFHRNEESAKDCCYNSSEFSNKESSTDKIYGPDPHIDLIENGGTIIPQAKWFPKETCDTQDHTSSMDASWRLDRSDGTNRSLNLTEIAERRPSAPTPMYPPLPFNPFLSKSPPPMPLNTDLTLGELMEIERKEEEDEEEAANYNHGL